MLDIFCTIIVTQDQNDIILVGHVQEQNLHMQNQYFIFCVIFILFLNKKIYIYFSIFILVKV